MVQKVRYVALFLDSESSEMLHRVEGNQRLPKEVIHEHVTFAYKPAELLPASLVGQTFVVDVIGFGNDGQNSGFLVEIPDELKPHYHGAENIHITTSMSEQGNAVDTSKLRFQSIKPFTVTGKLGYFAGGRIVFEEIA